MQGAGLKPIDLARATGRTSGAVTQWLNGSTKTLKADTASRMEAATGYRSGWIATGRGQQRVATQTVVQMACSTEAQMLAQMLAQQFDKVAEPKRFALLAAVSQLIAAAQLEPAQNPAPRPSDS